RMREQIRRIVVVLVPLLYPHIVFALGYPEGLVAASLCDLGGAQQCHVVGEGDLPIHLTLPLCATASVAGFDRCFIADQELVVSELLLEMAVGSGCLQRGIQRPRLGGGTRRCQAEHPDEREHVWQPPPPVDHGRLPIRAWALEWSRDSSRRNRT